MATTTKRADARTNMRRQGYIPATEAAQRLGYAAQSVYDWMDAGKVRGARLGKGRWVEWASVVALFKAQDPEAAKLAGIA